MTFAPPACVVGGRLVVNTSEGPVYRLNAAGDGWEKVGEAATKRVVARLVPVGTDAVVLVGGAGRGGMSRPSRWCGSPTRASRLSRRGRLWCGERPTTAWFARGGHLPRCFAFNLVEFVQSAEGLLLPRGALRRRRLQHPARSGT